MYFSELAPIILFCFNRPEHTLKTLKALKHNELADQSNLYIYCDGPKENVTKNELLRIKQVRGIIRSKQWCKFVTIIEREKNRGLAENIVDGVTKIVNKYGKAIILEDDIITAPGFLSYMNDALILYENDQEVMHISGYMFPIKIPSYPSTFFYNSASCWGWGTWARAWKHLILDEDKIWNSLVQTNSFKKFNIGGFANFSKQLRDNKKGLKKTWAIKWYGSIFINNGLCLHPSYSLVQNIGNDNSGTHSKKDSYFYNEKLIEYLKIEKIPLIESSEVREKMKNYYFNQKKIKHILLKIIYPFLPKKFKETPFIR